MRPQDFLALPKAELHLHLEGAIPLETLARLAVRQGRESEVGSLDDLRERFRFSSFEHFLDVFRWTVSLLATPADYTLAAEAAARNLAAQGVIYAEVMVGLGNSVRYGGHEPRAVLRAAADGFAQASSATGIRVTMHAATGRELGPEFAMQLVPALAELREEIPLVGFNLGGAERSHRLPPFAQVLAAVHELGLCVSLHAGELTGPQDVRDALELGAQRIGHGIRAIEDPSLLEELAARQVTLEICPVSNLCTGAVPSLAEHPLPELLAAGVPVSLASDDPIMFGSDVNREYAEAAAMLGGDLDTLEALARRGFEAAFLPAAEREELLARFSARVVGWRAGATH